VVQLAERRSGDLGPWVRKKKGREMAQCNRQGGYLRKEKKNKNLENPLTKGNSVFLPKKQAVPAEAGKVPHKKKNNIVRGQVHQFARGVTLGQQGNGGGGGGKMTLCWFTNSSSMVK